MNKTVIGAFEITTEALQARQDLLAAGYDASSMQVHSSSAPQQHADGPNDNPGFMEAIRSLFSWDLDDYRDDDYAEHYAEAARRGHAILSINVDDSEVDEVSDIMDSAGALDIDEKVAEWRSQGYSGGRTAESGAGSSLDSRAGSDPATGAVAGNEADSGLDRMATGGTAGGAAGAGEPTTGGIIGSGTFNTDMDQGSVPGYQEQSVTAPPAGRRRVHVLPHDNPASRNA